MEDDALTSGRTGSPDHVDDLFNYDFGLDELLEQAPSRTENAESEQPAAHATSGLGLGLDEEVKVTKKRQPIAKLDEGRLLSQPGIPKLRRTAKEKLKFRGKGHEFSDAARLLNFYQLWLDDLFPRAKFTDGLAMIERLGHSKRLQTMRREWIEEEKPAILGDIPSTSPNIDLSPETQIGDAELTSERHNTTRIEIWKDPHDSAIPDRRQHPLVHHSNVTVSADVDERLFMSDDDFSGLPNNRGAPDDDELDALLREQEDLAYKNTSI